MNKTTIAAAVAILFGLYARADENTMTTHDATPSYSVIRSPNRFGAGIIVGEPTGASLKYWLNDTLAVDGAVGWSFHDHTDAYFHSDILWHDFDLIPVSQGRLPVYFGAGGMVRFRDDRHDNQVGIRLPVGVSYIFDNTPVDIFAEVAPVIGLAPDVRGEVTGGIGIRYWF